MKDFLTIRALGRSDLESLIDRAAGLRDAIGLGEPVEQRLLGRCVANVFFEPSTRTRLSFDLAAQRLGAHLLTFDPATASTSKGESVRDTAITIAALGADILVVRHAEEGVPQLIADWTGLPVVNAGDGTNEHPTQALVDAVTLKRHFGELDGLRVGIVGDISHSRVAGSLVHALPVLGVDVKLIGPREWLPPGAHLPAAISFDEALPGLDVVYLLRVQTERGGAITESYVRDYQLSLTRSSLLREDAVIMHPGPMNRGVEITDDVADSPRSLIAEQVRNGVPARMAVLGALAGSDAWL